jgi:hypothetical protein
LAIGLTIIELSEEADAHYVDGEYVRLEPGVGLGVQSMSGVPFSKFDH